MEPLKRILFGKHARLSYSQCGEDIIIADVLAALGIFKPSYIDIGAHAPVYLSNTYLFYRRGCQGVCIEPNPCLLRNIHRKRPRDICLNAGIGTSTLTEAPFYLMTTNTLSTFSKESAEHLAAHSREKIKKIINVPLLTLEAVIKRHLPSGPDFISLDVEGVDLAILQSFDFSKHRPPVFCVETLTYTEDKTEEKILPTIEFMLSQGYFSFADTYVNTIFVDKAAWKSRK
jgi:FkbM family methyltransferase